MNNDELKKMLSDRYLDPKSDWPRLGKELCKKIPPSTLPFFLSASRHMVLSQETDDSAREGAAMAFEDAETLAYVLSHVFAPDFKLDTSPKVFRK